MNVSISTGPSHSGVNVSMSRRAAHALVDLLEHGGDTKAFAERHEKEVEVVAYCGTMKVTFDDFDEARALMKMLEEAA